MTTTADYVEQLYSANRNTLSNKQLNILRQRLEATAIEIASIKQQSSDGGLKGVVSALSYCTTWVDVARLQLSVLASSEEARHV